MNHIFTRLTARTFKILHRKAFALLVAITCFSFPSGAQFCIPSYNSGCSAQDDINSFTLTGQGASTISDLNTGCGPGNGYEDRTTVVPAVDLMQGGTYSGTLTTNYSGNEYYRIWIDFNDDTIFSPSEALGANVGPFGLSTPSSYSISIPLTAPIGVHRMRVRLAFAVTGPIDPCSNYSFGETHDYLANILLAPPCTGQPTITGIAPAGPISSCAGANQTLTLTVPIASGYFFQWQQSTNAGASWNNVATGTTAYSFTVTGSALYRAYITCTSSGLSDTSAIVSITATPPTYGTIPYFQDFETWGNYCDVFDIPLTGAVNWTNNPATGDNSWRRDDQGATANWSIPWGSYFPPSISGLHSARFASAAATNGLPGNLDLYLDCSQQTGSKQVYFYFINQNSFSFGDSLAVWLSDNGGSSFTQIGSFDSSSVWTKRTLPIVSNSAQTILRFQGKNPNFDFTDIGLDSVFVAPPCTGSVVAGSITPGGIISGCPGQVHAFSTAGTTMAGNITYQWQQSLDNGVTWTNVSGANGISFTTGAVYDTVSFRMYIICNGSGSSDTTQPVVLNISSPVYGSLPYAQGFENWVSYCSSSDVPSFNWLNTPETGDNSWRRDDEGATANWAFPPGGAYSPVSFEGSHSARFHTIFANFGVTGDLDLFVDCSAPGGKELQFHHINPSGNDNVDVYLSTNGGGSFTLLQSFGSTTGWTLRTVPFNSTSAQTVLRFRATPDFSDDIGIDNVKVLLPCTGAPVAGVVDSLTPCSGQNFNLSTTGGTLAAGMLYQWQESPNGVSWTNSAGGNSSILTTSITTPTWYRLIVTCTHTGLSDTSAPRLLNLGAFYLCYCQSGATFNNDDDIGNVKVQKYPSGFVLLNNGVASPLTFNTSANNTYSNFTNVPPVQLYKDSVYKFFVTQINSANFYTCNVAIYLDMNHDGQFDPIAERIMLKTTSTVSVPSQQVNDTFRIPDTAQVGLTGMRVVLVESGVPDPCGTYNWGETEDYLANISYPPCNAPANPGTAYISETSLCPGFPFLLTDTTHDRIYGGLSWVWQSSTDNVNWTDITGTSNQDTTTQFSPSVSTYYRLKVLCANIGFASYSNVQYLEIKPPYLCYCQSFANGGTSDVSDVGAFSIGSYVINVGGPHLNNPAAVNDYSANPSVAILIADSTYDVSAYHIMRNGTHQDAKVTLFIDFDHNFIYDVPAERVWTGYTTASDVFINATVTIPPTAVKEVLTGMRLILNNDVGANIPSDEACGPYTSGETEDFAVKIRDKNALGVHPVGKGPDFTLFPNPTSGEVTLRVAGNSGSRILKLKVTTVTGQQVYYKEYQSPGAEFATEIELGDQARGIYFVELNNGRSKTVKKLILK